MTVYTALYSIADLVDEYEQYVVGAHIIVYDDEMKLQVNVEKPFWTRCADCQCWYSPGNERPEQHGKRCPVRDMIEPRE